MNNEPLYIHQLGELFERVQLEGVFSDSKTFPDCTAKAPLSEILNIYNSTKDQSSFDLPQFIDSNFQVPSEIDFSNSLNEKEDVLSHIDILWNTLTRIPTDEKNSLIKLKYPYLVPGGRFREVYYWDSYFSLLGLEVSKRFDLIENIVKNFAYLLDTVGHIPNANRAYYVGRSQPPFFALMLNVLSKSKGDEIYAYYLPQLENEYRFWMSGQENQRTNKRVVFIDDNTILNRYWDENSSPRPESYKEDIELSKKTVRSGDVLFRDLRAAAESGWDFSSRWLKDPLKLETIQTTRIIPIDLNCLLYYLEKTLSKSYQLNHERKKASLYLSLAEKRKEAILKYCWNTSTGFFHDYNFIERQVSPMLHLGSCYPLFLKIATPSQSEKVARLLQKHFLKKGGVITTLINSAQQWDAPNGWAPLQWITYKGLKNYNHTALADELRNRWVETNLKVYNATGKLTEKYDVINVNSEAAGGEYPNQDGFGWTNGVLLKMLTEK